ncbi:MAG: hypothetical protein AABZ60_22240 [Planctomycetota bacterium]
MMFRRAQFTLLEMMIAVSLFAAVLAVIYSTLYKSSTIYKEDSTLLLFEYRVNQIMTQMTRFLRESWIRNKKTIATLADNDPSATIFRDDDVISMVNDAPDPNPLAIANNDLLVFSRPDPNGSFDDDTSEMIWGAPEFFRLARGDLNGDGSTATVETVSEAIKRKDYNRDGDFTDIFEVRELVRSNGTTIYPFSRRIFVLRATVTPPIPCIMVRDEIKTGGPAISLRFNFLFYDPTIDASLPGTLETLPGNAVVVLMNRQTD